MDVLSVALRAASFVFLFQSAGLALFLELFGGEITRSRGVIQRLGVRSALWAALLALAHWALEPARLAGELAGLLDPDLLRTALASATGAAAGVRIAGLVLLAATLRGESRLSRWLAIAGALLALCSFALVGHTTVRPHRWLLCMLLIAHVTVVGFWFGALPALSIVAREESAAATAAALRAFSAVAVWLVPGILLAGLALAILLIGRLEVLREPYGLILIGKVSAFAVLLLLASWNRLRLTPALANAAPRALSRLKRSVGAEYLIIVGVLAATALLTSQFSPD